MTYVLSVDVVILTIEMFRRLRLALGLLFLYLKHCKAFWHP